MRLDALLRPHSIAVVGASERPSAGRLLIESLDRIGFAGDVYPINPKYEAILGRRCYPRVADAEGQGIDTARERVLFEVREAVAFAENSPYPDERALLEDVYTTVGGGA